MRARIWNFFLFVLGAIILAACVPSSPPTTQAPVPLASLAATSAPVDTASPTNLADVLYVRAVQTDDETWTFAVTVQHPDTGWDNYADGWDVVTPEDTVLLPDQNIPFTRRLEHPHVDEQPFTRSQGNIVVPSGVARVHVRAHSLVGGYGGREVVVDLTTRSGPDFEVVPLD